MFKCFTLFYHLILITATCFAPRQQAPQKTTVVGQKKILSVDILLIGASHKGAAQSALVSSASGRSATNASVSSPPGGAARVARAPGSGSWPLWRGACGSQKDRRQPICIIWTPVSATKQPTKLCHSFRLDGL